MVSCLSDLVLAGADSINRPGGGSVQGVQRGDMDGRGGIRVGTGRMQEVEGRHAWM